MAPAIGPSRSFLHVRELRTRRGNLLVLEASRNRVGYFITTRDGKPVKRNEVVFTAEWFVTRL